MKTFTKMICKLKRELKGLFIKQYTLNISNKMSFIQALLF